MFATMSSSIEYVRAGKLRALAVTTATRSPALPDVPTVGEFVPGYEASFWTGIGAPKNTPAEIIDKLNKEINAGLADPKMKARFQRAWRRAAPMSPADFGKMIADETEKWGKVVKFAGIQRLPSITSRSANAPDDRWVQTRTSSLGAARPLPPSADIGPGGQSVGQAAQFCLAAPTPADGAVPARRDHRAAARRSAE